MKVIQTMADVQSLKDDERLPSFYFQEIYNQFLWTYKSVAEREAIDDFLLEPHACIYHFDDETDLQMLVEFAESIEYVDTEVVEDIKYFRIGIMQDHEMSVIYLLEGTLPYNTEKWLENQGERHV